MPVVRFLVVGIAKVMSKVFGLATMTFFGRMPSQDDDKMTIVALLSLTWLVAVAAIVVPDIAEMLPGLPEDDTTRRLIALATALVIPVVNGVIVSRVNNRDGGMGDLVVQIVAGYPYTAIIGGVVVAVVVTVPFVKANYLVRSFETQHLLVMIPEGRYDEAFDHLVELLEEHDTSPRPARANPMIRGMFRALTFVIERIFRRRISSEMRVVRGQVGDDGWYEITVHATDITILGRDTETSMLLPLLADELDERVLYFTWDDESQELEDEMSELRQRLEDGEEVEPDEVARLAERVRGLGLDKEEWDALRRNLYRLERDLYRLRLDRLDEQAATRGATSS